MLNWTHSEDGKRTTIYRDQKITIHFDGMKWAYSINDGKVFGKCDLEELAVITAMSDIDCYY